MYIVSTWQAPNGAVTNVQRIAHLMITDDGATAVVNSYTDAEPTTNLSWQDNHTVPAEALTGNPMAAARNWLVGPLGPFAGGDIMADPTPLEQWQATLWARVKYFRAAADAAGCDTPKGRVDTKPTSRDFLRDCVSAASIAQARGDDISLNITMADNSREPHNALELIAAGRVVALQQYANHELSQTMRDAIYGVDLDAPNAADQLALIESQLHLGWQA